MVYYIHPCAANPAKLCHQRLADYLGITGLVHPVPMDAILDTDNTGSDVGNDTRWSDRFIWQDLRLEKTTITGSVIPKHGKTF